MDFVYYDDEHEWPRLIMELMPLGNLEEQHEISRITEWEIGALLCQGLEVLDHLHSQRIVHRDLKPANILVQCRKPFDFRIKFADFGLAKDKSFLDTLCGNYLYSAPEIWDESPYTPKVDIWALGLIVFRYAYGLPEIKGRFVPRRWYQSLVKMIEDWDSEALIDFLSTSMLTIDPNKRLSARECLQESAKLREVIIPAQNTEPDPGTPTEKLSLSSIMDAFEANRSIQDPEVPTEVRAHTDPPRPLLAQRDAVRTFRPYSQHSY